MRRAMIRIATMVVALTAAAGAASGAARAASAPARPQGPSRAQMRRAVGHAERSSYLWATVNICTPWARRGGLLGIRGEMQALGFRSTLSMTVQLRQYDRSRARFVAIRGATATRAVTVGSLRTGVHQDGAEFHYSADTGLLDAAVTFTWTRNGRRLGEVTRTTTAGHHSAAFAEPAGHSAANCRL